METLQDDPKAIQNCPVTGSISTDAYKNITSYYDIAGPDYEAWSRNFNMHFGYCRSFSNIFFLERMLNNMNEEVLTKLAIDPGEKAFIADLGCGVGTVARYAAEKIPRATITGVTISDYQINKGRSLAEKEKLSERVILLKDNFEHLHFADESFTHTYAIESACHAGGSDKKLFISEMARILERGGKFCIADGFLKHDRPLPRFFNYLYKKILKYWALPCFGNIHAFETELKKNGLAKISIKEISWRIAPSVAYVPWTCIKFFAKEIWKNRSLRMEKERWYNVYGPVLGMILGLYRKHFGYYIISGEKM
ncbi:MAG: class I SAM-dependent methyltransferase [Chitinophagaceae bacterium]